MLKTRFFDRSFSWATHLILIFLCIVTIYPFLYIFLLSISNGVAASSRTITFYPIEPTLDNYRAVLENSGIVRSFLISVARTVIGTLLHVTVTTMVAYALSRKQLVWRRPLLIFFMIPMFFHGGLLPYYVQIVRLGLINNFLVYVLPGAFGVFHMLIAKTFFEQIPQELEEAARIDGADDFAIFFRIILPSSLPLLATLAIFAGVVQWNSWFDALLFVSKQDLLPMQTLLYKIILESQATTIEQIIRMSQRQSMVTPEAIKMTTLMVSILPILVIYPLMQRYFVKGIMIGAVKG